MSRPGFDSGRLLTFRLSLPESRYTTFQKGECLLRRSLRGPSAQSRRPRGGGHQCAAVQRFRRQPDVPHRGARTEAAGGSDRRAAANRHRRLLRRDGDPDSRGREFTDRDALSHPRVAVVNEAMARKHWPDGSPIGRRVSFSRRRAAVVRDRRRCRQHQASWARRRAIGRSCTCRIASRSSPAGPFGRCTWSCEPSAIRLSAAPRAARDRAARSRSADLGRADDGRADRPLAVEPALQHGPARAVRRLALTLAAVGIYGIVAYSVTERTHEIGVRLALGAQRRDVMAMVIGQGMTMTIGGRRSASRRRCAGAPDVEPALRRQRGRSGDLCRHSLLLIGGRAGGMLRARAPRDARRSAAGVARRNEIHPRLTAEAR